MADKACKGLDVSLEAFKNEKVDPDNLKIDIPEKTIAEIMEKDANAIKVDMKNVDDLIHNVRAWYDAVDHGKPFCVTCYSYGDEEFRASQCDVYDTKGLQKADPIEYDGETVSFEGYSFNGADNLYLASTSAIAMFGTAFAMLQ